MKTIIQSMLIPVIIGVGLGGCGHDQPANAPDNSPQANTTPSPSVADSGVAMGATPASTQPTDVASTSTPAASQPMSTETAGAPPNDDQILKILHAANRGEIDQAKVALSKSKNNRVKKFAAMMLSDHQEADAKGKALAKKEKLEASESATSDSLDAAAKDTTNNLKSDSAADFDTAYVDTQIKEHQDVLDMIDQKLAPSATDGALKDYLTAVRAKVAMHLTHAKKLKEELAK